MSVNFVNSRDGVKMGNFKSKSKSVGLRDKSRKSGGGRETKKSQEYPNSQPYGFSPEINEAYDPDMKQLRRTLERDPEAFILNNLMMCVQFFENYDEDVAKIKQTPISRREAELNAELLPAQKHALLPDVLQEHIARKIKFTSMRQTTHPTVEPLQPIRIYVVLDNVEVTEQNYGPQYSTLNDAVTYNMSLKPSDHEGYVKLQRLEVTPSKKNLNPEENIDLTSIRKGVDELYNNGDSMFDVNSEKKSTEKRRRRNQNSKVTQSLNDLHQGDEECSLNRSSLRGPTGSVIFLKAKSDLDLSIDGKRNKSQFRHPRARSELRELKETPYGKTDRQQSKLKTQSRAANGSPASSTSSGYRSGSYGVDSDSDYGYATITNFKTPKPLKSSRIGNVPQLTSEIPQSCFKKVTYTRDDKVYDPKKEKKQLQTSRQRRIKVALKQYNYDVWYLSSGEFMKHFSNQFLDHLAHGLGFDQETVKAAKIQGSVIYCDKVDVFRTARSNVIKPYEVIPSVWAQWPTCAQEWLYRPTRGTWPPYEVVEKVKEFGCYMIPEGYMPKRETNPNRDLEWQLTFPAAERYLETCLSYAQIRVYLIALMLHKTFIRSVDSIVGLTTAHIRNHLFWFIEEQDSPSRWSENRTGECLLKLLKSLYHTISQTEPCLSDYFVRDKNLFQDIPKKYLLHTQKQLNRIKDNPVMYVFSAMENIHHREEFFPKIDYEMLLRILTVDSLVLLNPALERTVPRPISKSSSDSSSSTYEKRYDHPGGFWDSAKMKNSPEQVYGSSRKMATNRTVINPRNAQDLIIEIPIRCAELDKPRLSALLIFFIKHFIKMAERCHQYRALQQKATYLNQSERLAVLLSEDARHLDDARDFLHKIRSLRKRIVSSHSQNSDAPRTPRRNPDLPILSLPLRDRFTKFNESLDKHSESTTLRGENEEYGTSIANSGSSYPYTQDERDDVSKVTKVVVHDAPRTKPKIEVGDVKVRLSPKPEEDEDEGSVSGRSRVVSIVKNEKESFLTETTYI